MKRALSMAFTLLVVAVGGCAPDDPPLTTTCASITSCALGEVCDRATHTCIAEPANRFVGAFSCTLTSSDSTSSSKLELSEVVGHLGEDRWALPNAACTHLEKGKRVSFLLRDLTSGLTLSVSVRDSSLTASSAEIAPDFTNNDYAQLLNLETDLVVGESVAGHVELAAPPVVGQIVEGYIDVEMTTVAKEDALFGIVCEHGRGECGKRLSTVGGALCLKVDEKSLPMCYRTCERVSDCSLQQTAVCFQGICTKPCAKPADCAPLQCVAGGQGEGSACMP